MQPTPKSVLAVLKAERLIAVGRDLEIAVDLDARKGKDQIATRLLAGGLDLPRLLRVLGRDELRDACRAHGIADDSRSRAELAERLMLAAAVDVIAAPPRPRALRPRIGDVVAVRQRQYLVEQVDAGERGVVHLVCLDDDAQGRRLQVLWELELGARVLVPEAVDLKGRDLTDDPRLFSAYYHALKWSCVTATDAKLFQSPFRAGIKLMNHQLTALKKALELPRVNLFIADDVGLGKTIEAGLVLQELILRQRVDFVVIVCPASVLLQWRAEMDKRFGLGFEIYHRTFVQRRRQERGFSVNPWDTHHRFIISYQTLRRPEYKDPLLQSLRDRGKKSLLILDEAHTAAPSSSSIYGLDSKITDVVRHVAPQFENRLFLSATPHNGHSNSFSSLLAILDEKRFTRGVPVETADLGPVMVRRLKEDLRQLNQGDFPKRRVGAVLLERHGTAGTLSAKIRFDDGVTDTLGDVPVATIDGEPVELRLASLLAEYTRLMRPERGPGRLVFINLQKRLLSSIDAFFRTLRKHADGVGKGSATALLARLPNTTSDDELPFGEDDADVEAREGEHILAGSASLPTPQGRAKALLDEMLELAGRHRSAPDGKTRALLTWLRQHICDGFVVPSGGSDADPPPHGQSPMKGPLPTPLAALAAPAGRDQRQPKKATWQDRRVIIFTEYGDTKKHLMELLLGMVGRFDDGEARILQLHGGMSDEARDAVQRSFNAPFSEDPVRILVCTDAAREGINLQACCADLFHFDVPWNPGRMEQRNGRIDRTLQPAAEVRCHYFVYADREEDRVLDVLVQKVERIQRELGSVGQVVMEKIAGSLEDGLGPDLLARLDAAESEGTRRRDTAKTELEGARELKALKHEIDAAARILSESRKVMGFDPSLLKDTIDTALVLSGFEPLSPGGDVDDGLGSTQRKLATWTLPTLSSAWDRTLDTMRPVRERDEDFWQWRKRPPLPVVFSPPERLRSDVVHLHLAHPFVQRLLSRFLAQGFSAQDLSRVTVVRNPHDDVARVVVLGRLTLFGPGALRLHDEVIGVAAEWNESRTGSHLKPFSVDDDRRALQQLESILHRSQTGHAQPVSDAVRHRLAASASGDLKTLWPHVEAEADARAHDAEQKLSARGVVEAEQLTRILKNQQAVILRQLKNQLALPFEQLGMGTAEERRAAQKQWEGERTSMEARLQAIESELVTEPVRQAQGYVTALRRVVPVGVVYLWPETR